MFSGDDRVTVRTALPEADFYAKVEDALSTLGRVRVSQSGDISIEPKEGLKSFLTEVKIDGEIRKKASGYDVSVSYSLSPSAANWILAVVLFCLTMVGAVIILFPLMEKDKVAKAVTRALHDVEDEAGDPQLT